MRKDAERCSLIVPVARHGAKAWMRGSSWCFLSQSVFHSFPLLSFSHHPLERRGEEASGKARLKFPIITELVSPNNLRFCKVTFIHLFKAPAHWICLRKPGDDVNLVRPLSQRVGMRYISVIQPWLLPSCILSSTLDSVLSQSTRGQGKEESRGLMTRQSLKCYMWYGNSNPNQDF